MCLQTVERVLISNFILAENTAVSWMGVEGSWGCQLGKRTHCAAQDLFLINVSIAVYRHSRTF